MTSSRYPPMAAGVATVLIACAPAMAGSWGISFGLQLGSDHCAWGPSVRTSVYYDQPSCYSGTRTVVYRSAPAFYDDYNDCGDRYLRLRPRPYYRTRCTPRRAIVVREYPPRVHRSVRVYRSRTCRPTPRVYHKGYFSSGCNRVYRTPRGSCSSYRDCRGYRSYRSHHGSYAPRHRAGYHGRGPTIRIRGRR